MAIGTPVELGHGGNDFAAGARTLSIASAAAVPAKQLTVLAIGVNGHCTYSSPTDDGGNPWTAVATAANGSLITDTRVRLYCSGTPNGIGLGAAINANCTIGIGGGGITMAAYTVSGVLTTPDSSNTNTGTTGDPSCGLTIVGPSTIAFAAFLMKTGTDYSPSYAEAAGWTSLNTGILAVTSQIALGVAYQTFATAGAKTHAPDITPDLTVLWSELIAAFDNALLGSLPASALAQDYRVPLAGSG